jgi:hypothetical protein
MGDGSRLDAGHTLSLAVGQAGLGPPFGGGRAVLEVGSGGPWAWVVALGQDAGQERALGAYSGHREQPDRSMVNAPIGDRDRSGATLAGRSAVELALRSP